MTDFVFLNFIEILFKKIPLYSTHVSLSIPENRIQKYPKLTSLQHFEIDIFRNFQKWKFLFFSILLKFCLKNFHFMAQWAVWHVFLWIPGNRIQKYPKLASLQHFEVVTPGNFQKCKFSFFTIFLKFFSPLTPGFLISPHVYKISQNLRTL